MEFYNQQKYKETCHSASQNNNAIRNGERYIVRLCGTQQPREAKRTISLEKQEIGCAELKVPYRQAHKQRSLCCSLCLTE